MSIGNFGFVAYGDHGIAQIDGENICVNMRHSVPAVTSRRDDMGVYYYGEVAQPEQAMLFHRSPQLLSVRGVNSLNGSRQIYSASGVTTDIYHFNNRPGPSVKGSWGLAIFNTAGEEVFNSNWKPMKIVDVINITGNIPAVGQTGVWQIPEKCVVALSTPTEYMHQLGNHQAAIYGGALSVNGNQLTYGWVHMGTFNTWDDIRNQDIPYYYGYDSDRPVQIIVAQLDYLQGLK